MADLDITDDQVKSYLNNYMRNIAFPQFLKEFFQIVADDEIEITNGDSPPITIETLQYNQHAIYLPPSVNIVDTIGAPFDVYPTAGGVANGSTNVAAGLQANLYRQRMTVPNDQTNVLLSFSNPFGRLTINYRIWRVIGLSV